MNTLHKRVRHAILLAGSLLSLAMAADAAKAQQLKIDKGTVLKEVRKGLVLPYQASGQHRAALQSGLQLTGKAALTERRDALADNSQYLPFAKADAPAQIAADQLIEFLQEYLANHRATFKVDPNTLTPADRPLVRLGDKVIVSMHQKLSGATVETALVQATFEDENSADPDQKGKSYRLVDITNQTYGELDGQALTAQLATLGDDPDFDNMAILAREDVITPVFENGRYSYKPGRRFLVEDQSSANQFKVSVGIDGKVRHAISQFQSFEGQVNASVFERGYFNGVKSDFPLKHALIGDSFTDETGFVAVPDGDYTLSLFSGGLLGQPAIGNPARRINIVDFAGTPNPRAFRLPVSLQNGTVSFGQLADSDFTAINTFVALNRIYDFALLHLDGAENTDGLAGNEVAFLSGGITVLVNQPVVNAQSRCNAFFNPANNSLNFFEANAPCGNFGQLNDVIYHEWGHALDNSVGPTRGITDGAFSEGLSDVISGYFTGDARVAPGFTTNNLSGGLRNLNNRARVGDASLAGVHAQGTIIGGAFWDLRENLRARYGASGEALAEKLFFQHLLLTDTFTQSYTNVLRLDDDDADLTNGTPNFCLINDAFARHGLVNAQGCQDAVPQMRMQILDQTADGTLMLEVSLPNDGSTAAICLAGQNTCRNNPVEDVSLEQVINPLAADQNRRVFRTLTGVPVNSTAVTFSVLVLNSDRSLAGVETVTVQSR